MSGDEELPDFGDSIDTNTFEQILEMDDDDDDREFSKGIVLGFFEQAVNTFEKMDKAIQSSDLETLSSLGHFLKGSSATLGLNVIRQGCEKIQHLGHLKDETGERDEKPEHCLAQIEIELKKLRVEYEHVEVLLRKFFNL